MAHYAQSKCYRRNQSGKTHHSEIQRCAESNSVHEGARGATSVMDEKEILTNFYNSLAPGIQNGGSTKTQPRTMPHRIKRFAPACAAWPCLGGCAVYPDGRAGVRRRAITDMAADRRWCQPEVSIGIGSASGPAYYDQRHGYGPGITASLARMTTGARTTARIPGPATADNARRHRKETHRERTSSRRRAGRTPGRSPPPQTGNMAAPAAVAATAVRHRVVGDINRAADYRVRPALQLTLTLRCRLTRADRPPRIGLRAAARLCRGHRLDERSDLAQRRRATQDDCAAPHITP